MRIHDVTVTLREGMATYAGEEPGPELDYHSLISDGKSANVSALSLGSHTGTHVDAPHHFLDNGVTVEQLPLEYLVGPCYVMEYDGAGHISAADLSSAGIPAGTSRLLVKTKNGRLWDDSSFHEDFTGLTTTPGRGSPGEASSSSALTTSRSSASARRRTPCTGPCSRRAR